MSFKTKINTAFGAVPKPIDWGNIFVKKYDPIVNHISRMSETLVEMRGPNAELVMRVDRSFSAVDRGAIIIAPKTSTTRRAVCLGVYADRVELRLTDTLAFTYRPEADQAEKESFFSALEDALIAQAVDAVAPLREIMGA